MSNVDLSIQAIPCTGQFDSSPLGILIEIPTVAIPRNLGEGHHVSGSYSHALLSQIAKCLLPLEVAGQIQKTRREIRREKRHSRHGHQRWRGARLASVASVAISTILANPRLH